MVMSGEFIITFYEKILPKKFSIFYKITLIKKLYLLKKIQ